ncbi:MAG: amidohydrolase family protein [Actinobacteria bacterium]|nr:amidohydrolase family protein [Actinomycetota bacterium]
MSSVLVTNVGLVVPGDPSVGTSRDTTICIEDGVVTGIGGDLSTPDMVIDANGLTAIPGLIDGHVHPTFGDWTPAQNTIGWSRNYLHGGTTQMVSAAELHVPGLPFEDLTPELVIALARVSRETTGRVEPGGAQMHCGTVLLVPGMKESHFDEMVEISLQHLKFIFFDWGKADWSEAQTYVRWARERNLVVKIHSGGVSRSGSSRVAGHDVMAAVGPDVVAHVSGGPIPMPDEEIIRSIDDLPEAGIEVCSSMNYRATKIVVEHLTDIGRLDQLTLGTDTPGGTGVIPRGMLRNMCFLSSICDLSPEASVSAATFNTARAHRIEGGSLAVGARADIVLLGPIQGSRATDALDCFALGDLPGISMVLVDGKPVIRGRSEQTPPPNRLASIVGPGDGGR